MICTENDIDCCCQAWKETTTTFKDSEVLANIGWMDKKDAVQICWLVPFVTSFLSLTDFLSSSIQSIKQY